MNFFEKLQHNAEKPFFQAIIIIGCVFIVNVGASAVKASEIIDVSNRFAWLNAASFTLFFAVLNSIYSIASKNVPQYWGLSMYSFMLVAGISGLQAFIFSGISIRHAGSYMWIYVVVTIGYLVFISLMTILKKVVAFAEKEEWNSPKMRPRR
jgi:drug/metabolite transporter (DMT)-like permease